MNASACDATFIKNISQSKDYNYFPKRVIYLPLDEFRLKKERHFHILKTCSKWVTKTLGQSR